MCHASSNKYVNTDVEAFIQAYTPSQNDSFFLTQMHSCATGYLHFYLKVHTWIKRFTLSGESTQSLVHLKYSENFSMGVL